VEARKKVWQELQGQGFHEGPDYRVLRIEKELEHEWEAVCREAGNHGGLPKVPNNHLPGERNGKRKKRERQLLHLDLEPVTLADEDTDDRGNIVDVRKTMRERKDASLGRIFREGQADF
jgi:hypothetical protein